MSNFFVWVGVRSSPRVQTYKEAKYRGITIVTVFVIAAILFLPL